MGGSHVYVQVPSPVPLKREDPAHGSRHLRGNGGWMPRQDREARCAPTRECVLSEECQCEREASGINHWWWAANRAYEREHGLSSMRATIAPEREAGARWCCGVWRRKQHKAGQGRAGQVMVIINQPLAAILWRLLLPVSFAPETFLPSVE